MDIVSSCLTCTPVPYLSAAFAAFRVIWFSVEQAQASKHQLRTLAQNIAQLLYIINGEYRARRLIETKTSVFLKEFGWLLDEVKHFVQQQADYSFSELFLKKDDRIAKIDEYHQRISMAVSSFEVSALINIQHWQSKNNDARVEDQKKSNIHLNELEKKLATRGSAPPPSQRLTAQPDTKSSLLSAKANPPLALPRIVPPAWLAPLDLSLSSENFPQSSSTYRAQPRSITREPPPPGPHTHHLELSSSSHFPSSSGMSPLYESANTNIDDSKSNRSANVGSSRKVLLPIPTPNDSQELEPVNWAAPLPTPRIIKHNSEIYAIAFSPNEEWIACGCKDQTVRAWEVKTGCISKTFEGHTGSVLSVAFSPDGKWIASGCVDTTIRVWEVTTERGLHKLFEGHAGFVRSVAFSPNGEWIASGSEDKTIRVWDVKTGRCVYGPFTMHTGYVLSVSFAPNLWQPWIASASADKTICVWNMQTGESVSPPFKGHTEWVRSIAFSCDGEWIASGSYDMTIRVWDVKTGNCIFGPFEGHTGLVVSVSFSPDGKWIASGSHDKRVRVWDVKTGKFGPEPSQGHTNGVHSVVFSPDGRSIASGSNDNTIRIWAYN